MKLLPNITLQLYKNLQVADIREAYSHTCQLLRLDGSGNPISHGTGVFIDVDGHKFMITAAHVIENYYHEIYIPVGGIDLLAPGGETIYTSSSAGYEKNDIDVAIFKLSDDTVSKLPPIYEFLTQNQLGINHSFKDLPLYSAVGYPTSQSKLKFREDVFRVKPFFYTTMPHHKADLYEKLVRTRHSNIILEFDQNRVFNVAKQAFSTGPSAHGMSGCGLWFSDPIQISRGQNFKRLVAIMTDWPIKNRKCWVGARIDIITEVIRKKYNLNLPISNILRVPDQLP